MAPEMMEPPPLVWIARGILLVTVAVLFLGGYGYFDEKYRTQELVELVQRNGMLIEKNSKTVEALITKPGARPLKFDACDGAAVVEAMRANGVHVKPQEFEARCEASRKN